MAHVALFLDILQLTFYRWIQQSDLSYRNLSIEDTMHVKAAKRPSRPKRPDAERVRNRPANYELGGARTGE